MTSTRERKLLRSLNTPTKIQDYLDTLAFNHEVDGESCRSAYEVIQHKKAHCLEGAFLACAALVLQKRKPVIVSLKVTEDDIDHVITVYKEHGYFGAISKTNHAVLGWRDPVYKTIRELVMSYFHEYFLVKNGEKTLCGYSKLINLNHFGNSWIDSPTNLFDIGYAIADTKHTPIIPKENKKLIRKATKLERRAGAISHDGK